MIWHVMSERAHLPTYCSDKSCELHGDMLDPNWHFCPRCSTNLIAWGTVGETQLLNRKAAVRYLLTQSQDDSKWKLMVRPHHSHSPEEFIEAKFDDSENCEYCDNSSGLIWIRQLEQHVVCNECIGGYTIPKEWREFQLWRRQEPAPESQPVRVVYPCLFWY